MAAPETTAVEVVDLASTPLREVNQRLHDLAGGASGPRHWRILNPNGAHALAAGLTLRPQNLEALRQRLYELARRALKPEDLQPALRLDAEIGLEEVSLASLTEFGQLQPTGPGNPGVQFFARHLTHQRPLQRIGRLGPGARVQIGIFQLYAAIPARHGIQFVAVLTIGANILNDIHDNDSQRLSLLREEGLAYILPPIP